MGPIDYLVVEFPGNQFNGEIVPALAELTRSGTIRVIDLLIIRKDAQDNVTWEELSNLPAAEAALWDDVDGEIDDLLNENDVLIAAEKLQSNSTAALLVFEHVWATRLRDAVVGSGGRLVDSDRVPPAIIEAAFAAARIAASQPA